MLARHCAGTVSLDLMSAAASKFKDMRETWQNRQFLAGTGREHNDVPDPSIPDFAVQVSFSLAAH